jgi:hypothetical protein
VGTYRRKLRHVVNTKEDFGKEKISVLFGCFLMPERDGCELNQGYHGYLVTDNGICCLKPLEGQVMVLKGIKEALTRKFEVSICGIGIEWRSCCGGICWST